jgi:hypothetical protein
VTFWPAFTVPGDTTRFCAVDTANNPAAVMDKNKTAIKITLISFKRFNQFTEATGAVTPLNTRPNFFMAFSPS